MGFTGKARERGVAAVCACLVATFVTGVAALGSTGGLGVPDRTFGHDGHVVTEIGKSNPAGAPAAVISRTANGPFQASTVDGDLALAAFRSDGTPDVSFGQEGKLSVNLGLRGAGTRDVAFAAAQAPGGDILVTGSANKRLAVLRLNPDGSRDKSFARHGIYLSPREAVGHAIAIDRRGRIVVAGVSDDAPAVLRLRRDGTPDPGFGSDGWVIRRPAARASVNGVVIDGAGGVVVGGAADRTATLTRLTPRGRIDPGYGQAGSVRFDLSRHSEVNAMSLDPGGGIVVLGDYGPDRDHRCCGFLARLSPDGELSSGFGSAGVSTFLPEAAGYSFRPRGLAVLADGAILVAGAGMVMKEDAAGKPDTGFGSGGAITLGGASVLAPEPGGAIYVGVRPKRGVGLARLTADGRSDTTFGTHGLATALFGTSLDAYATGVVRTGRGFVIVGAVHFRGTALGYRQDGRLDSRFGVSGLDRYLGIPPVAVQHIPHGPVVAAGGHFGVAALLPNGKPDLSFGRRGFTRAHQTGGGFVTSMAIQKDGKLLLAGEANGSHHTGFKLVRLRPSGSPDFRFGHLGVVHTGFGLDGVAEALAVQRDGGIVVAGGQCYSDVYCPGNQKVLVARYRPDGSLDRTFGEEGRIQQKFGSAGSGAAVAVDRRGRVTVLVQDACTSSRCRSKLDLLRYRRDGRPDLSFGHEGRVEAAFGRYAYGGRLLLQPSGRILVVGSITPAHSLFADIGVAAFRPDGRVDRSFGGGDGFVTANIPWSVGSFGSSAVLQRPGRLLVAGAAFYARTGTGIDRKLVLVRFRIAPP